MNIPNYSAYLRVLANGVPTIPFSVETLPPTETNHAHVADMIQRWQNKIKNMKAGATFEVINSDKVQSDLQKVIRTIESFKNNRLDILEKYVLK
jgi:hypothetical protein